MSLKRTYESDSDDEVEFLGYDEYRSKVLKIDEDCELISKGQRDCESYQSMVLKVRPMLPSYDYDNDTYIMQYYFITYPKSDMPEKQWDNLIQLTRQSVNYMKWDEGKKGLLEHFFNRYPTLREALEVLHLDNCQRVAKRYEISRFLKKREEENQIKRSCFPVAYLMTKVYHIGDVKNDIGRKILSYLI